MRRLLSRDNTPPPTTFDHFFSLRSVRQTPPRLVVSDASLFSCAWCRLCGRHTTHPSGSRPLTSRPRARRLPLVSFMPQKTVGSLPRPRVYHSQMTGSFFQVQFQDGSRQRRRQTQQARGEARCHGLRQGRIKRMVVNHFSSPSLTRTHLVARPQPKAL